MRKFQDTIRAIKTDREMGERYMIFEEMLREEKQEGRIEGKIEAKREDILELLEELGEIPEELRDRIGGIEEIEKLKVLHKMAARAASACSFEKEAEGILVKSLNSVMVSHRQNISVPMPFMALESIRTLNKGVLLIQ